MVQQSWDHSENGRLLTAVLRPGAGEYRAHLSHKRASHPERAGHRSRGSARPGMPRCPSRAPASRLSRLDSQCRIRVCRTPPRCGHGPLPVLPCCVTCRRRCGGRVHYRTLVGFRNRLVGASGILTVASSPILISTSCAPFFRAARMATRIMRLNSASCRRPLDERMPQRCGQGCWNFHRRVIVDVMPRPRARHIRRSPL
jgi:hypothetical protein